MYCKRCNVEVNNAEPRCPLCKGKLKKAGDEKTDKRIFPKYDQPEKNIYSRRWTDALRGAFFVFITLIASAAKVSTPEFTDIFTAAQSIASYTLVPAAVAAVIAACAAAAAVKIKNSFQKRMFI